MYRWAVPSAEQLQQREEERAQRCGVLGSECGCVQLTGAVCCSEQFLKEYESWTNKEKKAFLVKQWRAANK